MQLNGRRGLIAQRVVVGIESEEERMDTASEFDCGEEAVRLPHGPTGRIRFNGTGPPPFEEVRDKPVNGGREQTDRQANRIGFVQPVETYDRLVEDLRSRRTSSCKDVPQVRPEQAVEFRFVVRLKLVAVPPKPVAAFGR